MTKIFFIIILSCFHWCALAQWSTSTKTDSALYVCPGFYTDILTFNDGSSIVLGALQSYIFAQKLDAFGYRQWISPVQVLHNDSSYLDKVISLPFYKWGEVVDDGDGGMIHFWYDNRGAFDDGSTFKNNSIFAQRVDKYGEAKWAVNGLKVQGPETGQKIARMVNDGQGGCVVAWSESGFEYPGAPNIGRIVIQRLSKSGESLWKIVTDTSTSQTSLSILSLTRLSTRLILRSNLGNKVFDLSGNEISNHPFQNQGAFVVEADSVVFYLVFNGTRVDSVAQNYLTYSTFKFNRSFDSLWSCSYEIKDEASNGGYKFVNKPVIPDGLGGIFFLWGFADGNDRYFTRAIRINSGGIVWNDSTILLYDKLPEATFGGNGKLGVFLDNRTAQLYDSSGNPLWNDFIQVVSDPNNAYNGTFASDNNGGGIYAFWTTAGGVYVQHTGRYGHVGIITSNQEENNLSQAFELQQNFPNPFNPSTTIHYELPVRSFVTLNVYNILGQRVASLINEDQQAGSKSVEFDASKLPSGVYFYKLNAGTHSETRKMLLMK